MTYLLLLLIVTAVTSWVTCAAENQTCTTRVLPDMPTFPTTQEWSALDTSLQGEILFGTNPLFKNMSTPHNYRVMATPAAIAMVLSVEDVQKVVQFVRKHCLLMTVWSSGHSYIGRSTHDGALIINLERMKGKTFNLNSTRSPAGEVTVESGNSWMEVYQAVDQQTTQDAGGNTQRRVIVGGSAHTVAMGGYTQGGGHSPMCRTLGLAVDNLLEATIVLADGRKAVLNAQGTQITDLGGATTSSNETSLFWAIRGGGGGTWGVITHFTFKLHFAPQRFRRVAASWALSYWDGSKMIYFTDTLHTILRVLPTLSRDWGGYIIVSGTPLTQTAFGSVTIFFNHFGNDSSASNNEITELLNLNTSYNQYIRSDERRSTFLEYEVEAKDPIHTNTYIFDNFIQPEIGTDQKKREDLVQFFMGLTTAAPDNYSGFGCTGTMIGGRMGEVADGVTPVNPKFRSGLLALTCGLGYPQGSTKESFYVGKALEMRDKLSPLGEGTYFNEPAEDMADWKTAFWGTGDNYNRLLEAKHKWDPDYFFCCHNCVGSDESATCPSKIINSSATAVFAALQKSLLLVTAVAVMLFQ